MHPLFTVSPALSGDLARWSQPYRPGISTITRRRTGWQGRWFTLLRLNPSELGTSIRMLLTVVTHVLLFFPLDLDPRNRKNKIDPSKIYRSV